MADGIWVIIFLGVHNVAWTRFIVHIQTGCVLHHQLLPVRVLWKSPVTKFIDAPTLLYIKFDLTLKHRFHVFARFWKYDRMSYVKTKNASLCYSNRHSGHVLTSFRLGFLWVWQVVPASLAVFVHMGAVFVRIPEAVGHTRTHLLWYPPTHHLWQM